MDEIKFLKKRSADVVLISKKTASQVIENVEPKVSSSWTISFWKPYSQRRGLDVVDEYQDPGEYCFEALTKSDIFVLQTMLQCSVSDRTELRL